jgi:hypothetical protein
VEEVRSLGVCAEGDTRTAVTSSSPLLPNCHEVRD